MNCRVEPRIRDDKFDRFCGAGDHCELTELSGQVHVFTGDSLFPGGVGKTADPEKFTSLLSDVETKLFGRYDDSAIVYPGHGKDTTLGAERPHLQEWRERGWRLGDGGARSSIEYRSGRRRRFDFEETVTSSTLRIASRSRLLSDRQARHGHRG
ncbi:UNVERIFIED_ORG: hypothetical protein FNL38_1011362 [Nocardia globerula]|uniref:Metallo-beta-lactamase superfamily protein n=1 Tax=Nocardia globerula TaxID=1818 RepID=A0A652YZ78_NOCGL